MNIIDINSIVNTVYSVNINKESIKYFLNDTLSSYVATLANPQVKDGIIENILMVM
jgi:hypothetical protein